ncbi:MAG: hypothetical protein QOC96_714 [Acidobacteriota bacterium]|nr:hypothetical protein [Acidobacteriota bacterium]
MKRIVSIFLISMIHIACASAVYSKGKPDKIIITGGGLAQPIEITDRETLIEFAPYIGQFIDWKKGIVADPPTQEQPFEVYFYMKWKERHSRYDQGDLKMIYSVRYLPGRDGAPGFVYLPGKDDDRYYNNVGTILREGDDGKWHYASPAWDALMKRLITASKPSI